MKRSLLITTLTLLLLAACNGGADTPPPSGGGPEATSSPTTPAAPSPSPEGSAELARCQNPEGFAIGYPEQWHTNPGDVVPPCSQFHPERFEVPRGTDERVAAITAYIDPVAFDRVAGPDPRRDADREEMTIDGHRAVRLEYSARGDALWPEGTPITIYAIELPRSNDADDRTLFVDTIGLETFDYNRNQQVLDRIAPGVEITA